MTPEAPQSDDEAGIDPAIRAAYRPPESGAGLGLRDDFIMALRFFSRLPTGSSPHARPDLGRIAMALPLAALAMGIGPMLLLAGAGSIGLPGFFAAALAVGAMVAVGGGMMEDALADAADGLFGGASAERRLEIFKDSRHGTYGVAALCLFLVLRVAALGSLVPAHPLAAAGVWLAANIAGRSGALWLAVALPPARRDGAAATAGPLPAPKFMLGAALAALLVFILGAPFAGLVGVGLALAAVALVTLGWTILCRRLVGGQTGDLVGAAAGLGEIAALSVLLVFA